MGIIVIRLRADHPSGLGRADLFRHVASVVGRNLQWQGRPRAEESASAPTERKKNTLYTFYLLLPGSAPGHFRPSSSGWVLPKLASSMVMPNIH